MMSHTFVLLSNLASPPPQDTLQGMSKSFIFLLLAQVFVVQSQVGPGADDDDISDSLSAGQFRLPTYIFNIFPNRNVSAFVLFEEERVNRLEYGELRYVNITFEEYSDFIIQFRQMPTDTVRSDFTDFGFMESDLSANKEVMLLIRRNTAMKHLPQHHLLVFNRNDIDSESSRLYIYNAIRNTVSASQGMYFYGLYQRRNVDGSESESITQLAVNLQINQGIDINIQPMTIIDIKGFYTTIRTVPEFKNAPHVVKYDGFMTKTGGVRKYLIAYGDYTGSDNSASLRRPRLTLLNGEATTSAGYRQTCLQTLLLTMLVAAIITSIQA